MGAEGLAAPLHDVLQGLLCSEMQEREGRLSEELAQAQANLGMLRRLHQQPTSSSMLAMFAGGTLMASLTATQVPPSWYVAARVSTRSVQFMFTHGATVIAHDL